MQFLASFLLLLTCLQAQQTHPVALDNRTLWTLAAPRASLSPAQRATEIEASLLQIANADHRNLNDISEAHLQEESILLIGRVFAFSVTEEDARLENRPRRLIFNERKQLALDAIQRYRSERSAASLLRSSALALGGLCLAVLSITLLNRLYTKISPWLRRSLKPRSRTGKSAALLRIFEAPLVLLLRLVLRLSFFSLAAAIFFGLASFDLSLFPATAGISASISGKVWQLLNSTGGALLAYLPNLAVLFLVAAFTNAMIWITKNIAEAIDEGDLAIDGFHREWATPTYDLLKILLLLFALVVAFPYLPGGDSAALKGASIFIGVLVSLGSGSAMGNVISGVILTYMRPFRVGDRVEIAGTTGDVIERSLLVTRLRTIKNVEVILPNSAVLGTHILNYSARAKQNGLILHTTVTLGYDAPWRKVHDLLIAAALRTTHILPQPQPFVLQTSLNDSHISYELNAYTDSAGKMAELYSDLHQNIQEEFNAAGVEIMSPMYLSVRDGNTMAVPAASRPPAYSPPGFRIVPPA